MSAPAGETVRIVDRHARRKLPPRRLTITEDLVWRNHLWLIGIGFDRDGRAREVFVQGLKTGAEFEGLLDDACILLSTLLQMDVPARELAARLGREGPDPGDALADGVAPASPIGLVAARIESLETECGRGLRQAYAYAHRQPVPEAPA